MGIWNIRYPSTSNIKIEHDAMRGNVALAGQVKGASTFADYASISNLQMEEQFLPDIWSHLMGTKLRKRISVTRY